MPGAVLLLREKNATSLTTSVVEKALQRKAPLLEYDLRLTPCQLDFVLIATNDDKDATTNAKPSAIDGGVTSGETSDTGNNNSRSRNNLDEGFESDIDTLSIVSCDEPHDLLVKCGTKAKSQETDSANGSACSDTDDGEKADAADGEPNARVAFDRTESYDLAECSCYTDVRAPDLLLFVVRNNETFVFRLDDHVKLQRFYANFSALKAVANQRSYNQSRIASTTATTTASASAKRYNLLQRTDSNGVTHIEISSMADAQEEEDEREPRSSIISLNTPEDNLIAKQQQQQQQRKSGSFFNNFDDSADGNALKASAEDAAKRRGRLVAWNSMDDLLATAKPDRRKKKKPKAPAPPPKSAPSAASTAANVTSTSCFAAPNDLYHSFGNGNEFDANKLTSYQQLFARTRAESATATLGRKHAADSWTSSVPRLLKKQPFANQLAQQWNNSSNLAPMAYRYVDTTQLIHEQQQQHRQKEPKEHGKIIEQLKLFGAKKVGQRQQQQQQQQQQAKEQFHPQQQQQLALMKRYEFDDYPTLKRKSAKSADVPTSQTISNRLFGMSPKLRDFAAIDAPPNNCTDASEPVSKWSSLGELSYKLTQRAGGGAHDGSLKSVIKKEERSRKRNEKKVTFSAYATVQVV